MNKKKLRAEQKGLTVIEGQGKRFSIRNFARALVFYLLLFIGFALVAQLGYHWLSDQLLAWRLQVVAAEPGELYHQQEVGGTITREEHVYLSPGNGLIVSLAEPGSRVPSGTELARVGMLSAAEFRALRGDEDREPDKDLLNRLLNSWSSDVNRPVSPDESIEEEADEGSRLQTVDEELPGDDGRVFENGAAMQREIASRPPAGELIVIYSGSAGLVSHYIDGFEDISGSYFPDPEKESDPGHDEHGGADDDDDDAGIVNDEEEGDEQVEDEVLPGGYFLVEGSLVGADEPVIKIVDNWRWYYSVAVPAHPGTSIAEQDTVELIFNFNPSRPVDARLYKLEKDEPAGIVRLTYLIEEQLEGFDQIRKADATLIYQRRKGIIIPEDALVRRGVFDGVYLNQGGRVVFKRVVLIDRHDGKALVEDLPAHSMVITRPQLVEEGQRLN